MFQFDQDYLRVSKPITTDGLNLALDKEGKRRMKIVHMPLSAEPYLKRRNDKLPDNLKLVIERVQAKPLQAPANPNTEIETLKALLAQSEAEKEKLIKERSQKSEAQKEPVEIKEVVIEDEPPVKAKKVKDEKDK